MKDWRIAYALIAAGTVLSAQDAKAMEDELLALLNTPVTVASQKAMTTREAPGIVSLITREEILSSGARDLIDLLRMIPGFEFASDVQGVVGPVVRGNWAFEGKLLLLVDGQELNETRYGTTHFGNRIPLEQIRQIEIIRGPGSAIYGGFAELAVVNIKTRTGSDLNGWAGGINYGKTSESYTQRTAHVAYGQSSDTWNVSILASHGDGQRSELPWNSYGNIRDLKDHSALRQGFYNINFEYKGLYLKALKDDYEIDDFTFYRNPSHPSKMRLAGTYWEAKYDWIITDAFRLTPKVSWKKQEPWYYPDQLPTGKKRRKRNCWASKAPGMLPAISMSSLEPTPGRTRVWHQASSIGAMENRPSPMTVTRSIAKRFGARTSATSPLGPGTITTVSSDPASSPVWPSRRCGEPITSKSWPLGPFEPLPSRISS